MFPSYRSAKYVLEDPAYVGGNWTPAGATVERAPSEGVSILLGAGSIYRITPCTEEAAMRAAEASIRSELKLISLPAAQAIAAGADPSSEDESEDGDDEPDGSEDWQEDHP
ncbi:MAG: hypothetical protein WDO73_25345 [Ignavibacteriota bacterium]